VTNKGGKVLQRLFTERYEVLKKQLTRRLGSSDLAGEALHDAYVHLINREGLDEVRYPQSYVLKAAVNGAVDRLRKESRHLTNGEVEALYDYSDPAAGPAEEVEAWFDLEQAAQALQALTQRQRDILYSARIEGATLAELAERWNISTRMVSRELRAAHEFCAEHMKR